VVEVQSAPALATVAGVELGTAGYWDISNIKDWHPTSEDFAAAIAALDCPAIRRPVLKFGHVAPMGEGDPTIGNVDNLRLTDDGQTLVGDFVGVPAWLAESDSEGRSVFASAYPDRSGEWFFDHQCSLGHTHPFVLRAVALLGVWEPGIATLESLYDLYSKAPEKETAMAKAATVALAGTTADQVRKAYYEAEPDWYLWIREMYVDPMELIVQNDRDDSLERVPYTVSGEGEVAFGEGQPVRVEYVAARAAAEKPVVAYASRTEARPAAAAAPPDTSAAQAEETEGKEGAMPTLKEGLAQKLGIAADADDETTLKALDDALAKTVVNNVTVTEPDGAQSELENPAQVAAAAQKLGLTVLDEETARTLRADASAGREALSRIQRESDEKVVKAAISEGKIPPAREAHYLGLMERDRDGTTAWLASVPKEAAVPLTELGHSTEPVENVTENPTYKNWRF
jgi:hypothetical protein